MALPTQMLLCILAVMAIPGIAGSYYTLCPTDELDISTPVFRANLLAILDAVPVAAAPTGFAALRFGLEPTPAFVRGFCFADRPSPQQCLGCLQSTVAEMKSKNCTYSWSAGIWGDDCLLSYSNTNTSSLFNEKFRRLNFTVNDGGVAYPKFFGLDELGNLAQSLVPSNNATTSAGAAANTTTARGRSTVIARAHCARDRASDCSQCVRDSAQYLEGCPIMNGDFECHYLDGTQAGVAAVLGFNCYLRLEISPPTSHAGSLSFLFLYQLIGLAVYATMM